MYTPKWQEIRESQLKEVKGLLHIDSKKDEIDEILRPIVQEKRTKLSKKSLQN